MAYQDEMADLIGAKPRMRDFILSDPRLSFQLFFGPCYPAHYRLRGPHSWEGARQVITDSWEDTIRPTRTRVVTKQMKTRQKTLTLDWMSSIWFRVSIFIIAVLLIVSLVLTFKFITRHHGH